MTTFKWNKPEVWLKIATKIIIKIWGESFIKELKRNNITPNLFDDMWFESIVQKNNNACNFEISINTFTKEIQTNWSHIKVFHACRSKDVENYYSKGIIALTIKELDDLVVKTLQSFVSQIIISKILVHMHKNYDVKDEIVFISIDKFHLQLFCSHHLDYGSEYLLCSIMLLRNFHIPSRPILDSIKKTSETVPTIFECDIPIESFHHEDLLELSRILLTEGCKKILLENYYPPSRRTGFGINSNIKPSWIKNHIHPSLNMQKNLIPPVWLETSLYT